MKKNNKFLIKYKIFIIIGALFFVWVGFMFFVIWPAIKLLENNFDSVQMKLLDMKVNSEKLDKISNLREEFNSVENERQNLDVIFSKNNIVDLVEELESIAQKTGNTINITTDEENKDLIEIGKSKAGAKSKDDEFIKKLPTENYLTIKIKLEGNYNSLIKFLDKLNNIKYYNSLVSFDIVTEKVSIEDKNIGGDLSNLSISSMRNSEPGVSSAEKEKIILSSDLSVIFYSLEKNEKK